MESVDELCDHVAMINNSKKILDGDTEKIKMKYKSDNYIIVHDKKLKKEIITIQWLKLKIFQMVYMNLR